MSADEPTGRTARIDAIELRAERAPPPPTWLASSYRHKEPTLGEPVDVIEDIDSWKLRALQAELQAAQQAAQVALDAFNAAGEEFKKKYDIREDDRVDLAAKKIMRAAVSRTSSTWSESTPATYVDDCS